MALFKRCLYTTKEGWFMQYKTQMSTTLQWVKHKKCWRSERCIQVFTSEYWCSRRLNIRRNSVSSFCKEHVMPWPLVAHFYKLSHKHSLLLCSNKVLFGCPTSSNIFLEFPVVISAAASKHGHLWSDHSCVKYGRNECSKCKATKIHD